ncbi:unnamed protein product [Staurois parvus]|uniref:SPRY-associated domain-containing protein n=1 Tax=Staurois parvus TaxID=386267 RepID=A0ABN9FCA7_9NEOB|nr:unnamed protein product [Staurois parvus]
MIMTRISHTLYKGLSDIITGIYGEIIPEPADILLDVDTAHNYLNISDDRKTAHKTNKNLNRPNTPERFQERDISSGVEQSEFLLGATLLGCGCWGIIPLESRGVLPQYSQDRRDVRDWK